MAKYHYFQKRKLKRHNGRKRNRTLFYFKRYDTQLKIWQRFVVVAPYAGNPINTGWILSGQVAKNCKKYKPYTPESYNCPHCAQRGCMECRRHPFSLWAIARRMTNKT